MTLTVIGGATGASLDTETRLSYYYDESTDFVTVSGTIVLIGSPIVLTNPGIEFTLPLYSPMITPSSAVYSSASSAFGNLTGFSPSVLASNADINILGPGLMSVTAFSNANVSYNRIVVCVDVKYVKGT